MKKLTFIVLSIMLLCGFSANAFSWDGHWGHYGYREGHYYRNAGWWGFGGFVTGLAVGAYVASLPPHYETVEIDGVPYYYSDGYYYQAGTNGYVVVAPPANQTQTNPTANNFIGYILGALLGIIMLLCIGLLLKNLLARDRRSA